MTPSRNRSVFIPYRTAHAARIPNSENFAGGIRLVGAAVAVDEEVAAGRTQAAGHPVAGTRDTRGTVVLVRWVGPRRVGQVPQVVVHVAVRLLASVASVVGIAASSTGSIVVGNTGCTCTACIAAVAASSPAGTSAGVLTRWNSVDERCWMS